MQMAQLSSMKTPDLVALYNSHAEKPIKGWSKKRDELIARVKEVLPKQARTGRTIREASLELLCQVEYYEDRSKDSSAENRVAEDAKGARSVGLPYEEIISRLAEEFPDAQTSIACLRWYSVKVRAGEPGYEGLRLAQRRPRPSKKKEG